MCYKLRHFDSDVHFRLTRYEGAPISGDIFVGNMWSVSICGWCPETIVPPRRHRTQVTRTVSIRKHTSRHFLQQIFLASLSPHITAHENTKEDNVALNVFTDTRCHGTITQRSAHFENLQEQSQPCRSSDVRNSVRELTGRVWATRTTGYPGTLG